MVSNKKCTVGGVDGAVRGDGVGRGDIMGMGMVWRWSDGVGMGRCGDGVMVWGEG